MRFHVTLQKSWGGPGGNQNTEYQNLVFIASKQTIGQTKPRSRWGTKFTRVTDIPWVLIQKMFSGDFPWLFGYKYTWHIFWYSCWPTCNSTSKASLVFPRICTAASPYIFCVRALQFIIKALALVSVIKCFSKYRYPPARVGPFPTLKSQGPLQPIKFTHNFQTYFRHIQTIWNFPIYLSCHEQ